MTDDKQAQEMPLPDVWVMRLYELDEAAKSFKASSLLNPNTTQYPNFITDWLMALMTPEELVVLTYAIRHTLGYQKHDDDIGIDQFQYGIIRRDGRRLDCGTGLGEGTIRKALQFLCGDLGILIATRKGARSTNYHLNDGQNVAFPLNLAALVTREAALQAKMGERWIGKAAHARDKRAELREGQQPAMSLTAKDSEKESLTAKETTVLQCKNTKPTYQNPHIHTLSEQATMPPIGGLSSGNGDSVRAGAVKVGRVQKAVKVAGAAAIVAALPPDQADKARKMLRGYLAGKAIAQDKPPSHDMPDDEFVAANAVHVTGLNGGYKPSDLLNCVVWLVRVQQKGLMYITPKTAVANLSEWRAAGSPKYAGGVEI